MTSDQPCAPCEESTSPFDSTAPISCVIPGYVPLLIRQFTLRAEDNWRTSDGQPASGAAPNGALRRVGASEFEVYLAGRVQHVRTQYEADAAVLLQRMRDEQQALVALRESARQSKTRNRQRRPRNGTAQQHTLQPGSEAGDARTATVVGSSSEVSGGSSEGGEEWSADNSASDSEQGEDAGQPWATLSREEEQAGVGGVGGSTIAAAGPRPEQSAPNGTGASSSSSTPPPVLLQQQAALLPASSTLPASSSVPASSSRSSLVDPLLVPPRALSSGSSFVSLVGVPVSSPGQREGAPRQRAPVPSPVKEPLVKQPSVFDPLQANSLYEDPLRQVMFPLAPEPDSDSE